MDICEGTNRLVIVATERVPENLPTPGDTRFSIEVNVDGFVGSGSAWIDANQLATFSAGLRALEANRNGFAEVESMSPGQFRLRVYATNRSGHMAVSGRLSNRGQALEFGFPFCPSMLPGLVAEFAALAQVQAH